MFVSAEVLVDLSLESIDGRGKALQYAICVPEAAAGRCPGLSVQAGKIRARFNKARSKVSKYFIICVTFGAGKRDGKLFDISY